MHLHNCLLGCCELNQRTGPGFKNSNFCVSQRAGIITAFYCFYVVDTWHTSENVFQKITEDFVRVPRTLPEQNRGVSSCLCRHSEVGGWVLKSGDFRPAKIHRDAVSLLSDSLMVRSPTQQVADSWICFSPGLRTQEISFSPLKKIIGSIKKIKGNWVDMQTKI